MHGEEYEEEYEYQWASITYRTLFFFLSLIIWNILFKCDWIHSDLVPCPAGVPDHIAARSTQNSGKKETSFALIYSRRIDMHYLTGGSMTRQPLLLFLYFTLPVIPYIVGDDSCRSVCTDRNAGMTPNKKRIWESSDSLLPISDSVCCTSKRHAPCVPLCSVSFGRLAVQLWGTAYVQLAVALFKFENRDPGSY
jgi:hypothetical protein